MHGALPRLDGASRIPAPRHRPMPRASGPPRPTRHIPICPPGGMADSRTTAPRCTVHPRPQYPRRCTMHRVRCGGCRDFIPADDDTRCIPRIGLPPGSQTMYGASGPPQVMLEPRGVDDDARCMTRSRHCIPSSRAPPHDPGRCPVHRVCQADPTRPPCPAQRDARPTRRRAAMHGASRTAGPHPPTPPMNRASGPSPLMPRPRTGR